MSFQPLNQEMSEAQSQLEALIQECIRLNNEHYLAKVAVLKTGSELTAAKLKIKSVEEKIKTIREVAWNTRKESSL